MPPSRGGAREVGVGDERLHGLLVLDDHSRFIVGRTGRKSLAQTIARMLNPPAPE